MLPPLLPAAAAHNISTEAERDAWDVYCCCFWLLLFLSCRLRCFGYGCWLCCCLEKKIQRLQRNTCSSRFFGLGNVMVGECIASDLFILNFWSRCCCCCCLLLLLPTTSVLKRREMLARSDSPQSRGPFPRAGPPSPRPSRSAREVARSSPRSPTRAPITAP